MKTSILSTFSFVGLIMFSACAGEQTANKQKNKQEPETKGMTEFVVNEDTRTTGEYTGSSLKFYWTFGDKLWINNIAATPALKQDAYNSIDPTLDASTVPGGVDRVPKAKFWFTGNYTAASYPVRYTGTGNTLGDKITIQATQTQNVANDAAHIGQDGDCGIGTAHKLGERYTFTLDHKAAYATFIPYYSQAPIQDFTIIKIKVTADKAISGQFDFDDNGIDLNSRPTTTETNKSIELNLGSFAIPQAPNPSQNAATMVIAPGTYSKLRVEYKLRKVLGHLYYLDGTITKDYTNVTFFPGKNKRISTDFDIPNYNLLGEYYMWDAKKHYWYGHEADQPTIPETSNNTTYPKNNTDQRWYHEITSSMNATQSAANCPNVNEVIWYAESDPYYDPALISSMGYLTIGRIWFKKQSVIAAENGKTIQDLKDRAPDGSDYRAGGSSPYYKTINKIGKPDDISKYFPLPYLGHFYYDVGGSKVDFRYTNGEGGIYWTSTGISDGSHQRAYGLYLYNTLLTLHPGFDLRTGARLWTAQ